MCIACCTECFEGLARTFLYCTNLLVFLFSSGVLGLSVWYYVDAPSFVSVIHTVGFDLYTTTCIILMAASVTVIVITFMGCCGAARYNRCMLWMYFIFVVIILSGMGVGAYFVLSGDINTLKQPFIESLKHYKSPDEGGNAGESSSSSDNTMQPAQNSTEAIFKIMWDDFQTDYNCCGVDGWHDWLEYNPYYTSNYVPKSCCDSTIAAGAGYCTDTSADLHEMGCFSVVVEALTSHSYIIGIVAIGLFSALLVNAIIAIYMATCGYPVIVPNYRYSLAATT